MSKQIMTSRGMLDLAQLRKDEVRSRVPCGVSLETSYYLGDELVRRDQTVFADEPFPVNSDIGRLA